VEASIYDRFLEALKERVSKIKVGDPFDPETFQGPQVSQLQFDRIMGIIEAGKKDGATLVTGGHQHDLGGLFVQPTIFADVSDGSPVRKYDSPEDCEKILTHD
jgi:aldehyde dehydrogenase (NAD+)